MFDAHCAQLAGPAGWLMQVFQGPPVCCVTVGLGDRAGGRPELVLCGLDLGDARLLLGRAARILTADAAALDDGRMRFDLFADDRPVLAFGLDDRVVGRSLPVLGRWHERHGRPVPHVTQLLWPDERGVLPGEDGCDEWCVSAQRLTV